MANVEIVVATEYKGKPGFDKAEKGVSSLDKSVTKLAKKFAGLFAAQKLASFGKASIKAFAEDEAAATRLGIAVKNLGLEFANPAIQNYISNLERTSGVLDEQLRPAFQALLTTTGSVTKSQELLQMAIDGAKGSGEDLTTVSKDLAQAYVGNLKGLRKYNLGLTQAELKTMTFAQVQEKFSKQFTGANAAYLETYAGKMSILAVAADNAKETIGKGLVDALTILAGDTTVSGLSDSMQDFAQYTADSIVGLGLLIDKLKALPGAGVLGNILKFNFQKTSVLGILSSLGEKKRTSAKPFSTGMSVSGQTDLYAQNNAAALAAERAAKKRAQELARLQAAQIKALKDQNTLKKAGSIFDMQQIEILAALKGKISDEERNKLELQLALLQGNTAEAQKLVGEVGKAQGMSQEMIKYLQNLTLTNNPFAAWKAYLDELQAQAAKGFGNGGNPSTGGGTSSMPTNISLADVLGTDLYQSILTTPGAGSNTAAQHLADLQSMSTSTPVNIQIDGQTIASVLINQSASGNQAYLDRRTGGF